MSSLFCLFRSRASLLRIGQTARTMAIPKNLISSSCRFQTNRPGFEQDPDIIKKNGLVKLFQFIAPVLTVFGALWVLQNQYQLNITESTIPAEKVNKHEGSREGKILQAIDKATKPWHPETPVPWIPRQKYEETIRDAVMGPHESQVYILLGPIASGKLSILKHCLKEEPGR
jgi:hypothetical protein